MALATLPVGPLPVGPGNTLRGSYPFAQGEGAVPVGLEGGRPPLLAGERVE